MATVANGGSVTSSSGYDITFTSDAAGSSVLAFEQDVYNPSNGAFTYWVKIPTLSHTADTTLYLFYGNSSITTDHSNKTAVWDANYVGVWHLANGSTLSGADSTSSAYNLTNHNGTLATTGQVDGAASFNGSNNYLSNSALSISAGSSITISLELCRGGQCSIRFRVHNWRFGQSKSNTSERTLVRRDSLLGLWKLFERRSHFAKLFELPWVMGACRIGVRFGEQQAFNLSERYSGGVEHEFEHAADCSGRN
jgi:hypothetical protein